MSQHFLSLFLIICSLVTLAHSATIDVVQGPVSFYFVDCSLDCHELVDTRNENKQIGVYSVNLPRKAKLSLVVMCLNSSKDCKFSYSTSAWTQSVLCKSNTINTYPASNNNEGLIAEYSASSYSENTVRLTLSFKTTMGTYANTQLSENSIVVKDASIVDGSMQKINDYAYTFEVKPTVSKSNFAILLNKELLSEDGLPLVRGLIHTITYDPVSPLLTNPDYINTITVDTKEKHYTLSFDKIISTYTILKQTNLYNVDVQTEDHKNFDIIVLMKDMVSTGSLAINFFDDAKNVFAHSINFTYDPNAPLVLLSSVPASSANNTVPMNPRIELIFNQNVSINKDASFIVINGKKTLEIQASDSIRVIPSAAHANVVFIYLNNLLPVYSSITFPKSSFTSVINSHENESFTLSFIVNDIVCGTQYVTKGMNADDVCKCFSIHNQCQCICGSTYFVRDF